MNNQTAKKKLETSAIFLNELLNTEKFTPSEQNEIETICKKLMSLCGKEKKEQFNETLDLVKQKAELQTLIAELNNLSRKLSRKLRNEKKLKLLKKIEKNHQNIQEAISFLKIPEINMLLELNALAERNNVLKNYIENGTDAGSAFKTIEKLVGLKRKQIIDHVKKIIDENEKNGTLEFNTNYKDKKSKNAFENGIDNIRYNILKSPFTKKEHIDLWNIMLIALKQCTDETGIIQLDMPAEPQEYFKKLCLLYYVLGYSENVNKIMKNYGINIESLTEKESEM